VGERIVLMVGILFAMSGVICVYPYGGPLPPLKFINETIDGRFFDAQLHLLIKSNPNLF
jgi:hypothetical protein